MGCAASTLLLASALMAPPWVTQEPAEEPAPQERTEEDPAETDEQEVERVLTPKEEELKRKAAARLVEREERRLRREAKRAQEELKREEKEARQEEKTDERAATLIAEGNVAIEDQKYNSARERFERAKDLERGRSYEAQMGLARVQAALGDYAQAIQLAQRAIGMTGSVARQAEALTFAGTTTLAARPRLPDDPETLLPGGQIFEDAALRFFLRAIAVAPEESGEALDHLDRRFPTLEANEQAARLLSRYLETSPEVRTAHGKRVTAGYEALLTNSAGDAPIAVVGSITPPKRLGGPGAQFEAKADHPVRRRLLVALVIAPDGSVSRVQILNGINPRQDAAATRALRQWTYEPARLPSGVALTAHWLAAVNMAPKSSD